MSWSAWQALPTLSQVGDSTAHYCPPVFHPICGMLAVSGAGGLCLFCSGVKNCIFVFKVAHFCL